LTLDGLKNRPRIEAAHAVFYSWSNISGLPLPIVDCQFENDQSYENWQSAIGNWQYMKSTE